jgi:hypothetical protein
MIECLPAIEAAISMEDWLYQTPSQPQGIAAARWHGPLSDIGAL